ncbi:adenosylmethionine decarboxylase [Nocardia panacis]|uniref:S-adenosylmethionine decarboxylase proenzyme n=1 Tax=Nocardia panacis TaxID=2340916 RepID=A0A3A4JW48_9NOCA|nr:adenosylmethionine decarboxylase [Nocardia panacis]RJO70852.1 adenosylmethionine decarboxylase [Nocardia panacis]
MSNAPESVDDEVDVTGLFTGQHVLVELHGVERGPLDDEKFLCRTLEQTLIDAGATVLDIVSRRFSPQGVTVLAVLSESHASIHTYPELGSVFIDVFTCGKRARPQLAVQLLAEALRAPRMESTVIQRGRTY